MILFIRNILLFICFTVMLYSSGIIAYGQFLPSFLTPNLNYRIGSSGHMNSRIKDLKSYDNVDILFLGSSHCYRGFDTRIFEAHGIKSFNLGSSSQTPIQTEILLDRYLVSLNPKLVVFEVYPGVFQSDGIESALDLIANDRNDIGSINMALSLNHVKVYNTLIYGLFRDLLSLNSDFVENIRNGKDTYIAGGFVEKQLAYYKNNDNYSSKEWDLRQSQLTEFENILSELEERNINFVLVQAPITKELYDSYSNNMEVDNYFRSKGVYHNFNELLSLPSNEYFYDSHHLNSNGVIIFNNELIKILTSEHHLTRAVY